MPKYSTKQAVPVDVLVIGDHPCSFLAAALLKNSSKLRVVHACRAGTESEDRLITVNPELFEMHPILAELKKKVSYTPLFGLQFLSDDKQTRSEHRVKTPMIFSARLSDIREHLAKVAENEGVETLGSQSMTIRRVDEHGLEITLGKHTLKPTVLVLASEADTAQKAILGIPDAWGADVVHRFTYCRCKSTKQFILDSKQLLPMSLDLCGLLCWGWLIPGDGEFQLAVEQPLEIATADSGPELMHHWIGVLQAHGILGTRFEVNSMSLKSLDLPLAGALAHEGVANRTVMIGPAGGFYSACGEDIYPCCWSALFAVDVLKKALKETHLQDALNPYRQKWRTTLGDYLRGPQQNLRFLLPLVYRNPAMTARLAEAILLSKSVVR